MSKLIAVYAVILTMPALRTFFDLVPLALSVNLGIAVLTLLWALAQRGVWRARWFERFLDIEEEVSGILN